MFAFPVDSRGIRNWRKGCDLVSFSKEMVIGDGNLLHVKPVITTFDSKTDARETGNVMILLEFCVEREVSSKNHFMMRVSLSTRFLSSRFGGLMGIIAKRIPSVVESTGFANFVRKPLAVK